MVEILLMMILVMIIKCYDISGYNIINNNSVDKIIITISIKYQLIMILTTIFDHGNGSIDNYIYKDKEKMVTTLPLLLLTPIPKIMKLYVNI